MTDAPFLNTSEDKGQIVRPLVRPSEQAGFSYWLDETNLPKKSIGGMNNENCKKFYNGIVDASDGF